jgi:hypothetical protein
MGASAMIGRPMMERLARVSVALVMAAILTSSVGAPYWVVKIITCIGLLTVVVQIPDTVERWRALSSQRVDEGERDG